MPPLASKGGAKPPAHSQTKIEFALRWLPRWHNDKRSLAFIPNERSGHSASLARQPATKFIRLLECRDEYLGNGAQLAHSVHSLSRYMQF